MSSSAGSLPRYILQRFLLVIPMLWILMTMVFFVLRVAPGDPVSAALGDRLSPEALEAQREALGLNDPLIVQYWDYLTSILRLDFGTTFTDNQPILHVVRDNGGATLSLTMTAFIFALVIGIPLGLLAGRKRDTATDAGIRLFGILTYAAPIFFVGLLAQLWIARPLGLPTSGDASSETKFIVPERTHILAGRRLPERRHRVDHRRAAGTSSSRRSRWRCSSSASSSGWCGSTSCRRCRATTSRPPRRAASRSAR